MSLRAKRRVVAVVLALAVTWPLAHHALARIYEFDPWRFFGWAMYTVPDPRIELSVMELVDGQLRAVRLEEDLLARANRFAHLRSALGRLLPSDDLAAAILEARPRASGLVIRIRKWVLDLGSARIEARDHIYRFDRDGIARGSASATPSGGGEQTRR